MGEYQYKYDPPQRDPDQSGGDDLFSWLFVLITLAVFWPLGLFLLFRKLMSASTTSRFNRQQFRRGSQSGVSYHYTYTRDPSRDDAAEKAATVSSPAKPSAPQEPKLRKLAGRGFIIAGSIVSGIFGFSLIMELIDALSGGHGIDFSSFTTLSCFTGIGAVLLYVGFFRRKRSKLFRKYQALIGRQSSVSISTLVNATGRSYKKVCDELQDMLDFGVLPMGYLDLANDKLVLTSQGITDQPSRAVQSKPEEKEKDDNAILAEIRSVNDAIPDPVMSAKIDRIGELTGKILDYQRKNPDKDSQLRSFLNYYLPTTLKILRAYAQLDQQGIEGENISAAKTRIEGMMDKVVEGFEKQLDKLFRDEALDITSDVSVLEKMLDKDGLGQGGMTLEL